MIKQRSSLSQLKQRNFCILLNMKHFRAYWLCCS